MNTSQRTGARGDTGQRRRRWWRIWRLALLTMLALVGVGEWMPPAVVLAAPNVKVRLIIERVDALNNIDNESSADFYSHVFIDGERFDRGTINNNDHITPDWRFEKSIDFAAKQRVPIRIEIWDEDGGFNGPPDHVDINPGADRGLNINVDLSPCFINGDIVDNCRRSITTAGTQDEHASMQIRVEVDGNAHFSGQVMNGPNPLGGHTVRVVNTADGATLMTATTSDDGLFSIDVSSPPDQPMRLEIDDCSNCQSLNPLVSPTDTPPISTGWRQAVFPGCAVGTLCRYAPVEFRFRVLFTDLEVRGWEVTQGIQSLENGVPLVANKPTYVRVYARQLQGPTVLEVDAYLYGFQGASPLPGSPLRALYPVRSLVNRGFDRGTRDDGWLFQVPESWTNTGTIALQARVNPRREYTEQDQTNNDLVGSFTFVRKAPICAVFIPVRTSPGVEMLQPNFRFAVDMANRLLPSNIRVYSQDSDVAEVEARFGIPPWRYGPYEMEDDSSKVLASLWVRDQFSDDPDECDDANARTHYVGVVHPDAGGANGTALRNHDQMWFRLPPAADSFPADLETPRAATLAHELGHNYGRLHIDCPQGEPEGVGSYPYPACDLDDGSDPTHYGFNIGTREPIAPQQAGDTMSYAHFLAKPRWTSDFTWRALLDEVPNGALQHTPAPDAALRLAAASSVVLVTGVIDIASGAGELQHTYVMPTSAISQHMLNKWQQFAAPTAPATLAAEAAAAPAYHLRLLGAKNTVLDDRVVALNEHDDEQSTTRGFQLTLPAPTAQVRRIELLDGQRVITRLQVGTSVPTVRMSAPAGGETFQADMTISWRASDADSGDRLLYTVQYSPDSGQTWRALAANYPHTSQNDIMRLILKDMKGIMGSTTGGLIRVIATDGYNTATATSRPFTVTNRLPTPYITAPTAGKTFMAGEPVILRGGALDAETGTITNDLMQWSINDRPVGAGAEQLIDGLAPGVYTATLTVRDPAGQQQTAHSTFTVKPLAVPMGGSPALDGMCDDTTYLAAPTLRLAPSADGAQGRAKLVRTESDLWVCFSGLTPSSGDSHSQVAMRIDANWSRDPVAQPDDYALIIGEHGKLLTQVGDGQGGFINGALAGLQTQTSTDGTTWSAEMRISSALLGGWDHEMGIDLAHSMAGGQSNATHWPYLASENQPSTWAHTVLNDHVCYAVVDTNGGDDPADMLLRFDHLTGETSILGSTGTRDIEALAFGPHGDTLYGADADQLGVVAQASGIFIATANTFGEGRGAQGTVAFKNVDGLAFDPAANVFYGVHRRSENVRDRELLFKIDPTTGAHIADAFGPGVDYVLIDGPNLLPDIDDIAIDPTTGQIYGTSDDGQGGALVSIDKGTGAALVVGPYGIDDIDGLTFTLSGRLYGITGNSAPRSGTDSRVYRIDLTTGRADDGTLLDTKQDYEGATCRLAAPAPSVVAQSISSIQPQRGYSDRASEITIDGSGFGEGVTVRLGTINLVTTYVKATRVRAHVPAGLVAGAYDLTVTDPDGSRTTLPMAYMVVATPGMRFYLPFIR
jgi:hypothetical protein